MPIWVKRDLALAMLAALGVLHRWIALVLGRWKEYLSQKQEVKTIRTRKRVEFAQLSIQLRILIRASPLIIQVSLRALPVIPQTRHSLLTIYIYAVSSLHHSQQSSRLRHTYTLSNTRIFVIRISLPTYPSAQPRPAHYRYIP